METRFVPITPEQNKHIRGMWCSLCVYGLCGVDVECPPCIPHQRKDHQQGYYVAKEEVMVNIPMSFVNRVFDEARKEAKL